MMIAARLGCQVAVDVPGLDGEKGYRITNAGRAAYKIEKARLADEDLTSYRAYSTSACTTRWHRPAWNALRDAHHRRGRDARQTG